MRTILFECTIFEKFGKIWKNCRFSGRLWPDWGNTAQVAMARLGSIGLSVKNDLIQFLFVAIVTKFKNLSCFYDFNAMDIRVVLNTFPKTYIFITIFFISIKNYFFTIFCCCHGYQIQEFHLIV